MQTESALTMIIDVAVGDQEIMFEYPSVSEETRCENVWKVTDARENGDLRRLCPDAKHATIEYARKSKRRSLKSCDLIPLERIRKRTVEQIDDARATGRGRYGRSGPDHSPRAYLRAYHQLIVEVSVAMRRPCTDCPDSSEDSEGSTSAGRRLSGRRARCDAAESANATRHRVCLARCSDHARRTKSAFVLRARKRCLDVLS